LVAKRLNEGGRTGPALSDSAKYILALMDVPGVGRVAAGRLVEHFPDPGSLLECPREQRLLRLKGIARASEIVAEIETTLSARIDSAAEQLDELSKHEIRPVTILDPEWPKGLQDLQRSDRPVILYTYGNVETLAHPKVAMFARPPLSDHAFEQAQTALRHVLRLNAVPVTGATTSFDVVVHKVCASPDFDSPSIFVFPCGLGKMDKQLRPSATAAVRSRGLLISSFDMQHGPFEHDDFERAVVQAALAEVSVFVEPTPETPEWRALEWAVSAHRPVFVIGDLDDLPQAHRITTDTDYDWLELAITLPGEDHS
jgi:predicted Rossmann fold nucleotide-binding protein DprA/Smf involved in DNA uptake